MSERSWDLCRVNSFAINYLTSRETGDEEKSLSELTPDDRRGRLGRDYEIKDIVTAKVIEFYVPKNLRKPFKWTPLLQVRKGHRVLLADKEISLAGTEFQTDSGDGK